ncbi:MAG TPA: carboxylesterase family protein, partial [Mobilitalea sp.]|nr:carboxylesterase family protein [Mobilitalea sp.]
GDYGFPDVKKLTKQQYQSLLERNFGDKSKDIMKLYSVKGNNALNTYNELKCDWMMATQYYLEYVRSLNSKKSTYIYLFNHTMPGKETYGAFHSSDIAYWLNYFTPLRKAYWKKADYSIGDMMSSYLVNFAKTGNPNGTKLPKWAAYNKKSVTYQLIGDKTSNITLSKKKSDFWKQFFG